MNGLEEEKSKKKSFRIDQFEWFGRGRYKGKKCQNRSEQHSFQLKLGFTESTINYWFESGKDERENRSTAGKYQKEKC